VLHWLFKAPLLIYRANLGWLFGHRLARLTHRGRRSGRIRRTVVEVVRYDPRTREIVVAAGWGGHTDWYRNIQDSPALEVRTGTTAYRPEHRLLTTDELVCEVDGYVRRHPWVARWVFPRLLGLPTDARESRRREVIAATLRGVAFRPSSHGGARTEAVRR
jgi:deazaflavin-dependent oxidoreductase (nitroreductase family)